MGKIKLLPATTELDDVKQRQNLNNPKSPPFSWLQLLSSIPNLFKVAIKEGSHSYAGT